VDELQLLPRAVRCLLWERLPLELCHDAGVAQLLDMVDPGHPTRHPLTPELPQRVEVQVPEPLVP
jgi:hypothetical protein